MLEFDSFFAAANDGVVRSLTIVFNDRAAAEDAAQIGFERALRRWRTVGQLDRPGTWVYVVALRHARRQLARDLSNSGAADLEVTPSPEAQVVGDMWVAEVVATLPPRQRAAVVLRHLAGLQIAEIATALGVSVGTVKASLHAAYRRLRVELAEEHDTEAVTDAT